MKKFFKFGCLGVIILVVLIVIIAIASGGGNDSNTSNSTSTNSSTKTDVSKTKSPVSNSTKDSSNKDSRPAEKPGVLTKEKFDKIKSGMTYEEVTKIIGSKGELLSESGEKGSQYHTEMYQFETDGFMSNSIMMFQGGKLINKAQVGFGGDSNASITKAEFDKIQNGMTYEQVQKIIGGAGEVISESGKKGTDLYTVMISYKGEGDPGANANFMFQGNKLQNKSQLGLR